MTLLSARPKRIRFENRKTIRARYNNTNNKAHRNILCGSIHAHTPFYAFAYCSIRDNFSGQKDVCAYV